MDIIYGFIVYEKPVEEYFRYAASHGISHLEIDLMKKHSQLRTFTPERIQKIKQLADEYHIQLSLHPPYNLNLCAVFPLIRQRNIAYLRHCVSLAQQLNARYITVHIGDFNRSAIWAHSRRHPLDRAVKSLQKVLEVCETCGVCLALENVIPIPLEAGFSFLGDNLADFEYIFSCLKSDYLKLCLDIGHANTSDGPLSYIERLGEKIINVHYHDNHGKYDEHLNVGDGTVPWKNVLDALKKINFHGPFISECFKVEPHQARTQLAKYF